MMNEISLKFLVCHSEKSLIFVKSKKKGLLPHLENLLVFGRLSASEKKLNIENFKVTQVKLLKNIEVCVKFPQSESIFTLAFTSGTGGNMKILKVTQSNLMCSIIGTVNNGYDWGPDDTYFSYIPLSIPMERFCLYAISKTMTRIILSSSDISSLSKELVTVKPTIIILLPEMLEEIYKNVMSEFNKLTGLRRSLAFRALKSKLQTLESTGQVSHKFFDSFVFKKIRDSLGGKLRQIVTGSYCIFPLVLQHMKVFFSCHVIEGYGVVEANTCNIASLPNDTVLGHQGGPMSSLEARLRIVPNLGSLFDGPVGELCLRGEIVCQNYFDGQQVSDDRGWFRTGDIFYVRQKGNAFEFVEKCDQLVFVNGSLVAIGKLEAIFRCSLLVKQIFIHCNCFGELLAVVVPCERIFDGIEGIEGVEGVGERIRIDLEGLAERAGIDPRVRVKKVFVEKEPWKSDELVTATMKLKRYALREKYKDLIGG
jgi:long-chain acyl-CoA synthetase